MTPMICTQMQREISYPHSHAALTDPRIARKYGIVLLHDQVSSILSFIIPKLS